jgi:hypothetical protein
LRGAGHPAHGDEKPDGQCVSFYTVFLVASFNAQIPVAIKTIANEDDRKANFQYPVEEASMQSFAVLYTYYRHNYSRGYHHSSHQFVANQSLLTNNCQGHFISQNSFGTNGRADDTPGI